MKLQLPLVFACSGCSPAGRLAYDLAQELDRRGVAEMSCLAGIGAAKGHFLKQLQKREVWVIDGCPIECALGVFHQAQRQGNAHIRLHNMGVKKKTGIAAGWDMERLIDAALDQVSKQQGSNPPLTADRRDEPHLPASREHGPHHGPVKCEATAAPSQTHGRRQQREPEH